jgi:nucleoside-diphosphate-sugar epimerase
MKVLIVGASLIGSQVARVLVENGQRPVLFDKAHQHSAIADIVDLASVDIEIGDILRPLELVSAAQKYEITDIVHLAANPMLTAGAQSNPYAAIELNVMGTTNILEVARQLQLHRVVMASSSAVIESLDGGGDVDSGGEEAFPRPMTFYGATKQVAENLGLNYARAFDLDFVGLRFASVAGPWRGAGGGVPSTIFREALCAAIAGENVEITHRVLEWLYVKDAATATWLALQSTDLKSRIFNISMGESISPYDFRDAMIKVFPECVIEMKDQEKAPSGSAKGGLLNLRRAFEELEYSPTYNMTEAIRDCAEFYKKL